MTKRRVWIIDLLKAVCIILVILTHSANLNPQMLDKTGIFYYFAVNKCVPAFLFISGYVMAMGKRGSFWEEYYPSVLVPKLLRFIIPMVLAFLGYVLIEVSFGHIENVDSIIHHLKFFDFGPGSYYAAIMLQFVFVAPVMLLLVNKWSVKGLVLIGVVNFVYEVLCSYYSIDIAYYRIIMARYLLVIALGMYFGFNRRKKQNVFVISIMFAVGLSYVIFTATKGYTYKIFTISPWNRSNFLAGLYVAGVLCFVIKLLGKIKGDNFICRFVSKIGQSTYHIMYSQMLYFVTRYDFDRLVFDMTSLPLWAQYTADIAVCVMFGIVFCAIDNKIFGKLYKTKK